MIFLAPRAALLGALLLACQRAPESDHVIATRQLCAALADARASPAEAARRLGGPAAMGYCADALPRVEGDACARDQGGVCALVWAYRARSPALCGGEACSYGCELRVLERAPEETCGARAITGEERAGVP